MNSKNEAFKLLRKEKPNSFYDYSSWPWKEKKSVKY